MAAAASESAFANNMIDREAGSALGFVAIAFFLICFAIVWARRHSKSHPVAGAQQQADVSAKRALMAKKADDRRRLQAAAAAADASEASNADDGDWRSSRDTEKRREMIQRIVRLLKQKDKGASNEWLNKLPRMVKQLEVSLYRSAPSFEAYSDTSTLTHRLQLLAVEIAKKTAAAAASEPSKADDDGKAIDADEEEDDLFSNGYGDGPPTTTPAHQAAAKGDLRALERLPSSALQVRDRLGYLPLHSACRAGNIEAVEYLLQRRPRHISQEEYINTPTHFGGPRGETPLALALFYKGEFSPIAHALSEMGGVIIVGPRSGFRSTPLFRKLRAASEAAEAAAAEAEEEEEEEGDIYRVEVWQNQARADGRNNGEERMGQDGDEAAENTALGDVIGQTDKDNDEMNSAFDALYE